MLTLSPMVVAPMCCVGDPLQLTCTPSIEFIKWSILYITAVQINANQFKHIKDHNTTFTFTRSSAQHASSLISTLSIDSVSFGLNGTVVQCMYVTNPTTSASTTIQVIGISNSMQTKCQFL